MNSLSSAQKQLLGWPMVIPLVAVVVMVTSNAQEVPGITKPIPAAPGGEVLIPAAFGLRTDRDGNSWTVESDGNFGRIGGSMVNSGLLLLLNEEKFVGFQPMMTGDGHEFVIRGKAFETAPGLIVERRVRVMDKPGGLRYAELLYNGSTDPLDLTIALTTHFSGNYKTFLSDRGRAEPAIPGRNESGIIVLPGASEATRAYLFTLSDEASSLKPTISAQNRYGLTFRYQVGLKPGETAVIMHHVAQVIIPQGFDRRSLLTLTGEYALGPLRDSLPNDLNDHVQNVREVANESPVSLLKGGGIDSLGVDRGARDVLAIGEVTRLYGRVEGDPVRFKGSNGDVEIPLENLAAIAGPRWASSGEARVYLNDGQIFTLPIGQLDLALVQDNGERLAISPADLDRLVFAAPSGREDWRTNSRALLETRDGDRIRIHESDPFRIRLATAWGTLEVGTNEILSLKPAPHDPTGHWIVLKDGTQLFGLLKDDSITLTESDLGPLTLSSQEIGYLYTSDALELNGHTPVPTLETSFKLSGGQRLTAPFDNGSFSLVTGGTPIETPATEIRILRRVAAETGSPPVQLPGDSYLFEIERWDGGVIRGQSESQHVSVSVGEKEWQIPLRDLLVIEASSPLPNEETLTRINDLIEQLGAKDWATRERATRELGAFGYLARSVLQRELAVNPDLEAVRRIERILSGMN